MDNCLIVRDALLGIRMLLGVCLIIGDVVVGFQGIY